MCDCKRRTNSVKNASKFEFENNTGEKWIKWQTVCAQKFVTHFFPSMSHVWELSTTMCTSSYKCILLVRIKWQWEKHTTVWQCCRSFTLRITFSKLFDYIYAIPNESIVAGGGGGFSCLFWLTCTPFECSLLQQFVAYTVWNIAIIRVGWLAGLWLVTI